MSIFTQALDWGVPPSAERSLRLRIQVTNGMSWFGLALVAAMALLARLYHLPPATSLLFAVTGLFFLVVLALNRAGAIVASRFTYLITAYIIILGLVVSFPPEVNFHQYLIPGVGMSLVLLEAGVGWPRRALVVAGVPVYALGVVLQQRFEPPFDLSASAITTLAVLNTLAALATSIAMFTIFSRQSDGHLAELERTTAELQEVDASLVASNRQLDAHAHMISHDLKTPLTAVVGTLELLSSGAVELPPEDAELVVLASGSARHMATMIDELLDYARNSIDDEGSRTLPVSVFGLVHSLARLLDTSGADRVVCDGDDLVLEAHPVPLSHVLHNLLSNALKYSPKPGSKVVVRCWSSADDGLNWISVRDEGIGIPEAALDQIFRFGETAHGETRSDSTGVGLHVVETLVTGHGGTIQVASVLGEGSTFTFSWR